MRAGGERPTTLEPFKGTRCTNLPDELMYAESRLHGICVTAQPERLRAAASPKPDGSIMARESKNAKVAVMGNSVADNPPTRVAAEFAMLDVLSGGRSSTGSRRQRDQLL